MFDPDAYLDRIGVEAHTGPPSLELLASLQLAHLTTVPFENLHVFHRRGVRTDLDWSYRKVVDQRRGGWCFELNGTFGELLRRLGFQVDYVACRVWDAPAGNWGPDFDHLGLVVHLDGSRFLVDVGFGDCCVHPLLLESAEREAVPRRARVEVDDDSFTLTELMPFQAGGVDWEPQTKGTFTPRLLPDFDGRNHFLQTSPDTFFTQKPFATRALDAVGGRVTLLTDRLKWRDGVDEPTDQAVLPEEWSSLLALRFGLDEPFGQDGDLVP